MRKTLVRSTVWTALFIFVVSFLMMALNTLNGGLSDYLNASGNEVAIDGMGDKLYTVAGLRPGAGETSLIIKSDNQRPVAILIDNLEFPHEVAVNGQTVSQNIDKTAFNYDSGYAYQIIEVSASQYIDGQAMIEVFGSGASGVELYLSDSGPMQAAVETRTICYAVMLTCLVLIFFFCIIHYFYNRHTGYYLLFAANAVVSVIKSVNLGELFILAGVFGFTAANYAVIDSVTGNINSVLTVFIMLNLLQIPANKWWKASMAVFFLLLTFLATPTAPPAVYSILQFARVGVCIGLSIYGCVRKRPFGIMLFILNTMFLSFMFYGVTGVNQWHRAGALDFYIFFPYLGNIICLSAILLAFMKSQLLKTKALEAQQKEFERVALLRGIGHDLKLPLSVIKTCNQMTLKYDLGREKREDYARMSLEAASELEKMTNNISSFLSLNHAITDSPAAGMRESFDKVKRYYTAYAGETGCYLTTEWEGGDASLPVSPMQLERMLLNLLDNAFKYNKPGGDVRLSCHVTAANVVIRISDTGIGIDQAQLDQIFTPFYRAQESRTKNGLGLGLSVVKGIVDTLDGTIKTESEKGGGTTFTVILPIS